MFFLLLSIVQRIIATIFTLLIKYFVRGCVMVLLIDKKPKILKNVKIEKFSIVLYFPIVFHCLVNNSRNFYAIDQIFCQKLRYGTFN